MCSHPANHLEKNLWGEEIKIITVASKAVIKWVKMSSALTGFSPPVTGGLGTSVMLHTFSSLFTSFPHSPSYSCFHFFTFLSVCPYLSSSSIYSLLFARCPPNQFLPKGKKKKRPHNITTVCFSQHLLHSICNSILYIHHLHFVSCEKIFKIETIFF